jgi:hypothetical protein
MLLNLVYASATEAATYGYVLTVMLPITPNREQKANMTERAIEV